MKTEARFILIGTFAILLFGLLSSALLRSNASTSFLVEKTSPSEKVRQDDSLACTMDAKICPDGTFVGRVAPYCQFAACPSASPLPLAESR